MSTANAAWERPRRADDDRQRVAATGPFAVLGRRRWTRRRGYCAGVIAECVPLGVALGLLLTRPKRGVRGQPAAEVPEAGSSSGRGDLGALRWGWCVRLPAREEVHRARP